MSIRKLRALVQFGCATAAAGVAAGAYAHGGVVYVPIFTTRQIEIESTWVTDGNHPYAIWQAKSLRLPGALLPIKNHAAVDFGPMFPTQVYRSLNDLHLNDGSIYVAAGTSFVKLNGGPLNKFGGAKFCTWNINNVDYPNGRYVVRLFTPPRGVGSYNTMTCVETGRDGLAVKVHDVRSDNLGLLTETKDAFLYGGPDLKADDQVKFEQIDNRSYRTGGHSNVKFIALSISIDKQNHSNVCLDEVLMLLPIVPPSIKIGEKCFGGVGTTLDAFDGQYKLDSVTPDSANITILKPFNSPTINPG